MNCIHDTYLYMPCYGYQWLFQYLGMCTYLAGRSHPDIICLRAYGNSYVSFIYSTEIFVTMFVCLFETYSHEIEAKIRAGLYRASATQVPGSQKSNCIASVYEADFSLLCPIP